MKEDLLSFPVLIHGEGTAIPRLADVQIETSQMRRLVSALWRLAQAIGIGCSRQRYGDTECLSRCREQPTATKIHLPVVSGKTGDGAQQD